MELKLHTSLTGHGGDINSCDFGPQEKFATASSDHNVRLWQYNSRNGKFEENASISPIKHHTYRYYASSNYNKSCVDDGK